MNKFAYIFIGLFCFFGALHAEEALKEPATKRITVEISLYPLSDEYLITIRDFIERIKAYKELDIITTATSTLIVGEHTHVFEVLSKEMGTTFASGHNIFVMKVLGFERDIHRIKK